MTPSGPPALPGPTAAANRTIAHNLFGIVIHEYVHTLEHPAHVTLREGLPQQRGGFVLREGMTDFFAKVVPNRLTFDAPLRAAIERPFHDDPAMADGYPDNLTAWFRGPTLVLVEAALPRLAHPVADLLADLGDPEARLDDRWGVMTVAGGTRVYPGRGIAVFVGPEGQALRVSLFAPVTLDAYIDRLRRHSELTELPLRSDETGP